VCLGIVAPTDRQPHQYQKDPDEEQVSDDDQSRQLRGHIFGQQMRNTPRNDEWVQHHDDRRNKSTRDAKSAMHGPSSCGD